MHMEYLFQLTKINSLIEQSLKNRGDNKLARELSYIYRNPDYMILAMTNGTAVENFSKPGNRMGNHHKSRIYTNRSATFFKNSNSPTKNICQQNESIVCDKSKLRPKSSESIEILMPNPTRHGSPKLKPSPRASPSKEGNTRSSPTVGGHYAGAKFCEPPAPNSLPKPPLHWTSLMSSPLNIRERVDKGHDASHQLKILLNVQA